MSCSLIPEKPLLISPSLAATIGLEEAAMLSVLNDFASHQSPKQSGNYHWYSFDHHSAGQWLPFWTAHDIQRISKNLVDKGILLLQSAPFQQSGQLHFAFNETQQDTPATAITPSAHNTPVHGKHRIPPNWQPSDDVLAQIAQRNIPRAFAMEQLPEFITYWRERDEPAHSWGAKFQKQVIHAWRNNQTMQHRRETSDVMSSNWRPSEDAIEVLTVHAGINPQFVEDAIPEFVLYWQERGESSRTWNSKFIQHVRRQWNRYTATVENETVPKPLPDNWQPGDDVYDVLRLANIDLQFAKQLLPEFILYWQETKQVNTSWNTKYLQHVKYHWAKSHNQSTQMSNQHGEATHNTRGRSLSDDLSDRSWAY
ncbi:DnaT-like ssDNA-binding domain-containing protein [Aurantivibrio plasticivorans]